MEKSQATVIRTHKYNTQRQFMKEYLSFTCHTPPPPSLALRYDVTRDFSIGNNRLTMFLIMPENDGYSYSWNLHTWSYDHLGYAGNCVQFGCEIFSQFILFSVRFGTNFSFTWNVCGICGSFLSAVLEYDMTGHTHTRLYIVQIIERIMWHLMVAEMMSPCSHRYQI